MVRVAKEQKAEMTLAEITRREVDLYVATSDTSRFYPVLDDENHNYAVVVVENDRSQEPAWLVMLARVVGDFVVIEEDRTDKPLVDALMVNGGVPRDKIVLAYRGESLPDSESE
jgi:hypothetical protein